MPQLVQGCFRQLTTYNDNVCLITKDNYNEYCHIPDYVLQKLYRQEISITHFSDILRVSLLAENGGLWLDSTCWVAKKIPEQVYNLTFFSPCTKNLPDMPLWSNSRWCTWAVGTNEKNNKLFCFMRDVFYAVCKSYKSWPFYLFLDYCYDFAYRNFPEIKAMIDANPENNIHRNDLHFMLNKQFNEKEYENLCSKNWLFKLSYKTSWKSFTTNGAQTYYGRLIENLR